MKKLFIGFALAVFFVACGDDPSSAKDSPISSSEETSLSSNEEKSSSSNINSESSSSNKTLESSSSTPAVNSSSSSTESFSSEKQESSSSEVESYFNPAISYGEFLDTRDQQSYKTVKIGTQTWMAQNNNYVVKGYDNSCAYTYLDSDLVTTRDSCGKYGRVYNINSAEKSCPEGWHLPSHADVETLISYITPLSKGKTAQALKSIIGWNEGEGTDLVGFSAIPENLNARNFSFTYDTIPFVEFWTNSSVAAGANICFRLFAGVDTVEISAMDNLLGKSVRCIMDEPAAPIKSKDDLLNPDITYGTVTDLRDLQSYKTITIGDQTWMAENLNYADSVTTPSLLGRSNCYGDSLKNCEIYGRLYSWTAAIDSVELSKQGLNCGDHALCEMPENVQGICPEGWQLPKLKDFQTLIQHIGTKFTDYPGLKLKSKVSWKAGGNGTDVYGFSLASADHKDAPLWIAESKASNSGDGYVYAHYFNLSYNSDSQGFGIQGTSHKYSVRCLKSK